MKPTFHKKEELQPITLRLPATMLDRIRELAKANDTFLNQAFIDLLSFAIWQFDGTVDKKPKTKTK